MHIYMYTYIYIYIYIEGFWLESFGPIAFVPVHLGGQFAFPFPQSYPLAPQYHVLWAWAYYNQPGSNGFLFQGTVVASAARSRKVSSQKEATAHNRFSVFTEPPRERCTDDAVVQ